MTSGTSESKVAKVPLSRGLKTRTGHNAVQHANSEEHGQAEEEQEQELEQEQEQRGTAPH